MQRITKLRKRNLSMAWIDYQKAFDSVPHTWLLSILEIYRIHPTIRNLLKHLMGSWRTSLSVRGETNSYITKEIPIRRGIFQGDSLSPLWFCMALNPLSAMLNRCKYGYTLDGETQVTHLFYMDDLKLYAKGKQQLQKSLELVGLFSNTIHMKLGLDKCATIHVQRGKMVAAEDMVLMDGTELRNLEPEQAYRYLGILQGLEIKQHENKQAAEKELLRRTHTILNTYLHAKNKINAINTWAIPTIAYTFGTITWSKTDLERMDRKIRTAFTRSRMLHPNSAIERLYLSREEGGRGLSCLEMLHRRECQNLKRFFRTKDSHIHRTIIALDRKYTPLKLAEPQEPETENKAEVFRNNWKSKPLHGRYYTSLNRTEIVDIKASNTYLTSGYLFPETEGFLLSIQDQVVPTRTYLRAILKQNVPTTKCRFCNQEEESIQHLISGCTYLAPTRYLARHDSMGKVVHQLLCLKYGLLQKFTPYHVYTPKSISENDRVKIYWNMTIHTDRTVQANRPDLILWHKGSREATIVDFAVPLDDNLDRTNTGKIAKYQELAFEIKDMWQLKKVNILPLIISANGLVHKHVRKNLKTLDIPESGMLWMQKAVILGTVGIVRRSLDRT